MLKNFDLKKITGYMEGFVSIVILIVSLYVIWKGIEGVVTHGYTNSRGMTMLVGVLCLVFSGILNRLDELVSMAEAYFGKDIHRE